MFNKFIGMALLGLMGAVPAFGQANIKLKVSCASIFGDRAFVQQSFEPNAQGVITFHGGGGFSSFPDQTEVSSTGTNALAFDGIAEPRFYLVLSKRGTLSNSNIPVGTSYRLDLIRDDMKLDLWSGNQNRKVVGPLTQTVSINVYYDGSVEVTTLAEDGSIIDLDPNGFEIRLDYAIKGWGGNNAITRLFHTRYGSFRAKLKVDMASLSVVADPATEEEQAE